MAVKRTEEWTKEFGWGLSTIVVDVRDGDLVLVDKGIWEREFDGDPADAYANIDANNFKVPYSLVRERLVAKGWSKRARSDVAQAQV